MAWGACGWPPAADITAVDHHLTALARKLGADDLRTMDQRRADLAVDLLTGRSATDDSGVRSSAAPAVAIVVPVQSLLGVDDTPGELSDRSATVPAPLAQQIASQPGTLFYRLLTDERGQLLDVTELGRFPSRLLGFAIDIRDGTCAWRTCTTAAAKCDRDHTQPTPDGPTTASNLGNGCRRHHRGKTHGTFGLRQPTPGSFVWSTPAGYRYVVEPEPLPVGAWPAPTVVDEHTSPAEWLDLEADDPALWEATIVDALGPTAGPEPLRRSELAAIAAGPGP